MTYKVELKKLKEQGVKKVLLNGFKEDIDYVYGLTNLLQIEIGIYVTE